ncbi:MAG: hypothetical protein IJR59_02105 [Firmicutes bacterium]|nr:hypothetical protein [Bacillota bacterium]
MEESYAEKCYERGRKLIKFPLKVVLAEIAVVVFIGIIDGWSLPGFSVGEKMGDIIYTIMVIILDLAFVVVPVVLGITAAAGVVNMLMAKAGGEDCTEEYIIFGIIEVLICIMHYPLIIEIAQRW